MHWSPILVRAERAPTPDLWTGLVAGVAFGALPFLGTLLPLLAVMAAYVPESAP